MDSDRMVGIYADLWRAGNQIKTNKIMVYLVAQPLLGLGVSMGGNNKVVGCFFCALGIVFSVWWFFCIGRTIGFQDLWKKKIEALVGKEFFPSEEEKKEGLLWYGRVDAKIACLAPVMAGAVIWLIVLVYMIGYKGSGG